MHCGAQILRKSQGSVHEWSLEGCLNSLCRRWSHVACRVLWSIASALRWFLRADDRGEGSRVWHGRSVGAQASAPGSTKALLYHQEHTHTDSFSLTIDSAGLIVAIPPLCFSSSWPRASYPLKSPPPPSLLPSSHLSLLSVVELFIGVCSAKWPVLCWCRRLHFTGILSVLVCLCG